MSKNRNSKTFYALSLAFQLGFLIIIPIFGFILLGYIGDEFLETRPLLLIFGIIIGIIITIYEVYSLLIPLIKNDNA